MEKDKFAPACPGKCRDKSNLMLEDGLPTYAQNIPHRLGEPEKESTKGHFTRKKVPGGGFFRNGYFFFF